VSEVIEEPLVFVMEITESDANPNPGYTHRCDVFLFEVLMWRIWGKSSELAAEAGRRELSSRLRGVLKSRG
jgi:hypothetical protein